MKLNLENLKKLCLNATPGPWKHEFSEGYAHGTGLIWQQNPDWEIGMFTSPNVKSIARVEYIFSGWNQRPIEEADANAEFIATANPATVLKLIEALELAREALKQILVPASMEILDCESMYDFWHASSYEKLEIAQKALTQLQEILE